MSALTLAEEMGRTFWNFTLALTVINSFPQFMLSIVLRKRVEKLSFFCLNCLLTKPAVCGIIEVGFSGPRASLMARIPDRIPHMEIFIYF